MKKLLSPSVLSLLVGACAMASVILCVMHIHYSRKIRIIQGTQARLLAIQKNQVMMRQLGADLRAYSRTNAAIRPLLEAATAKPTQP